jgi:hypothetical protein
MGAPQEDLISVQEKSISFILSVDLRLGVDEFEIFIFTVK